MSINSVPKAELHVHIEGTLEAEMVFAFARRNGMHPPAVDVNDLRAKYAFTDLQSFLNLYYENMAVLRTELDFTELTDAYLTRAREAGVRHAEIFFDPQAHQSRGVPLSVVLDGLWSSISTSQERFGISTALIMCFLRDRSVEEAMQTLDESLAYRERLVGVGLDSAEVGHPPSAFADVFARARSEGLRCVAHAGEEGPPEYVWQALDLLGVDRIDHGIRCMEDPALVARLRADQIPITVCPLSNVRLGVFPTLSKHVFPKMLDAGLLVTVNSDDPAYFGGYVDENFATLRTEFGLTKRDLGLLASNSFNAAFLPPQQRDVYLREVEHACSAPEVAV